MNSLSIRMQHRKSHFCRVVYQYNDFNSKSDESTSDATSKCVHISMAAIEDAEAQETETDGGENAAAVATEVARAAEAEVRDPTGSTSNDLGASDSDTQYTTIHEYCNIIQKCESREQINKHDARKSTQINQHAV
jgi:hypothetical protein